MKKKIIVFIALIASLALCACGANESTPSNDTEKVNADSPDYWIEKAENVDKILMTQNEIKAQNDAMMSQWGTDWYSGYYDVCAFPETIDKEWLTTRICYLGLRDKTLYKDGEVVTKEQWDAYYDNLNLEKIDSKVKYAVLVDNAAAYDLPTADVLASSATAGASNTLQQTTLKINEPVVVLHQSSDEKWLYVVANEYIGWVKEEFCAYCNDYVQWEAYVKWENAQDAKGFLMVCKDTVLEATKQTIYMGSRLEIAKEGEGVDSNATENYDYVVRIPEKDENGLLAYSYAGVNKSDAYSEGYLAYTRENIVKLAFQELGEPYGWGGANGDRDCSMYIKDIYACFGIEMPRNSRLQMAVPIYGESLSGKTEADISARMENAHMGDVLGISGHVMLYLGKANGQHYVISMLSSYVPETVKENFGDHVEAVNQVQVNTLDVRRRNGNTWLQELIAIVDIESKDK